jgi:hypothetical protein
VFFCMITVILNDLTTTNCFSYSEMVQNFPCHELIKFIVNYKWDRLLFS